MSQVCSKCKQPMPASVYNANCHQSTGVVVFATETVFEFNPSQPNNMYPDYCSNLLEFPLCMSCFQRVQQLIVVLCTS